MVVSAWWLGSAEGRGRPGGCATRGQTDIRGLDTAGPWFVVRARCLGGEPSPGFTDQYRRVRRGEYEESMAV